MHFHTTAQGFKLWYVNDSNFLFNFYALEIVVIWAYAHAQFRFSGILSNLRPLLHITVACYIKDMNGTFVNIHWE